MILKLNINFTPVMLWPQIKLTSYDFSEVHITGEFDNRPGTGRFLRNFSCVVTYSTGAGSRLYNFMITSADMITSDIVRCPADFTRMKQIFTWNDVYITFKIRHHSYKETGCLNKKDWGWLWHIGRYPPLHYSAMLRYIPWDNWLGKSRSHE